MIGVMDQAPNGAMDMYTAITNTALTVPISGSPFNGVLFNDSDPDGDSPLSAVLLSGPSHGTLNLNANGSFTYTPATNYSGLDTFQYRPWDGVTDQWDNQLYGMPVTVAINVIQPIVNINVDSNNDGVIDMLDDPASDPTFEEQEPGLIVLENINDDDGNGVSDLQDTQASSVNDLDLERADLSIIAPPGVDLGGFQVVIRSPDFLRVWDTATKDHELTGVNFTLLAGQTSFSKSVYLEGVAVGSASITLALVAPAAQGGRDVNLDFVAVKAADPTIHFVTYLDALDPDQGGILSHDNPDYFKGGYRFIPGAQGIDDKNPDGNYRGRNVVRVRATMDADAAKKPTVMIAFRSFDVDDPARTDPNGADDDDPTTDATNTIDTDDPNDVGQGGDNRGTLVDIATTGENRSGGSPGASVTPDAAHPVGYEGQLRKIVTDFSTSQRKSLKWNAEGATIAVPIARINGQIVLDANGQAYAEVEMATTFSPGDSFRVLAIASNSAKMLADLNNGGFSGPNSHRDVPTVHAASGVNNPAFDSFLQGGGKAAEQLSVWRKVHMETDRMAQPTGDRQSGTIVALEQIPGNELQWYVKTDIGVLTVNEYESGTLRWNGHNYEIDGNTTGKAGAANGVGTVVSQGEIQPGEPSTMRVKLSVNGFVDEDYLAGGTIWIFNAATNDWDNYHVVSNDATTSPLNDPSVFNLRVVLVADSPVALGSARFMRGTQAATFTITIRPGDPVPVAGDSVEVFADDFTVPGAVAGQSLPSDEPVVRVDPSSQLVYDAMYSLLRPGTDRSQNHLADAYLEPDYDALSQFDSTLPAKTHFNSQDWAELVDAQRGSRDLESELFWVTYVAAGYEFQRPVDGDGGGPGTPERSPRGRTHHKDSAVVAVETVWDTSMGIGGQNSFFNQLGKTTLHEVGHELGLSHRDADPNIMKSSTSEVSLDKAYFDPMDVSAIRMLRASPGGGSETIDDDEDDFA